MSYVYIVVALALLQFVFFGMAVGWARGKYKVAAPATTGDEVFERYFRVQMNTLEQLVVFVPSVLLFAHLIDANWAAGLGAVYLLGRVLFFLAYVRNPKGRGLGFMLTQFPNAVLVVGVLISGIRLALA